MKNFQFCVCVCQSAWLWAQLPLNRQTNLNNITEYINHVCSVKQFLCFVLNFACCLNHISETFLYFSWTQLLFLASAVLEAFFFITSINDWRRNNKFRSKTRSGLALVTSSNIARRSRFTHALAHSMTQPHMIYRWVKTKEEISECNSSWARLEISLYFRFLKN